MTAACWLIVTDGDRVLCADCFREGFSEQDPATHFYVAIEHGVCDSCELEIKKANAEIYRQGGLRHDRL